LFYPLKLIVLGVNLNGFGMFGGDVFEKVLLLDILSKVASSICVVSASAPSSSTPSSSSS
jgi:hypothetical protein